MLHSAPKSGPFLTSALVCGVLVAGSLFTASCSESGTPAPAKPTSTASAANTPADTAKPAAPVADATKKPADPAMDATKKAADAANKPAAMKPADAPKPADKTAEAAKPAPNVPPNPALDKAKSETPSANPARPTDPNAEKAALTAKAEADARAKAAAADGKVNDPLSQDVDPNSKARLTYEFGTDTKNFGKVMQGDVLNHKFALQSSGEEDLVIKQAKPTCGCTVAQVMIEETAGNFVPYQYGKAIPPGRKVEIGAQLHTQNKRGHAGSKINIFTNDPRGQTILSLEAEVDPFFQVNPPNINFNNLSAKDTATDKLVVTTTKGDRVKLTAIKDNMPQGLKIDLNPLDADAEGKATRFEMVVTAGPGLNEGNLAYAVPLRSDFAIPGGEKLPNGQAPTYEIQATVMARVTGAISFNPAFVSLGLIRPGQTLSRSVRITCHDPEFKLTDPKIAIQGRDTPDWEFAKYFSPLVRPVAGENSVDVELTLNGMPDTLSGSFSGMLVIQLGHPEKPEIKLPITGVCRGGSATGGVAPAPAPSTTPLPSANPPK